MCIITTEEMEAERQAWLAVSKTHIFARRIDDTRQAIAYSMSIASPVRAAMILPLPVAPGSGEDAVRFIDLSGYPSFFTNLDAGLHREYVAPVEVDFEDSMSLGAAEPSILQVHEVGDFEASYVPSKADFVRLDPRFRLPETVWHHLPDYDDYGFAVFQLKLALSDGGQPVENTVHPMAFDFPSRDPARLYFPTVHVHDGTFHDSAGFFHSLYCQRESARDDFKRARDVLHGHPPTPALEVGQLVLPDGDADAEVDPQFRGYEWYYRSEQPPARFVRIELTQGLVDAHATLHAMRLFGRYPNQDIWLG